MLAMTRYLTRRRIARSVIRGRQGAFILLGLPEAGSQPDAGEDAGEPVTALEATTPGGPRTLRRPPRGAIPGIAMASSGPAAEAAVDAEPSETATAPRGITTA